MKQLDFKKPLWSLAFNVPTYLILNYCFGLEWYMLILGVILMSLFINGAELYYRLEQSKLQQEFKDIPKERIFDFLRNNNEKIYDFDGTHKYVLVYVTCMLSLQLIFMFSYELLYIFILLIIARIYLTYKN